jgi:hypothetical protein
MPRHIWAYDYARFGCAMDTKARLTLGVNVQPKSSIPIGAKVEINLTALH